MPVLFIGHGSPMNAIEDNAFSRAWERLGKELPRPEAILSVSAHWESYGTKVTAVRMPRTIHDFSGFPKQLYEQSYPAPGSPDLARDVARLVGDARLDTEWGLDHGTWVVLRRLFPKADVPVVQLSLDKEKAPRSHYEVAARLAPLRERGVLVMGSGNVVHNLGLASEYEDAYDWAIEFDETVKWHILEGDHERLIGYESLGEAARLSVPTNEHYLPLLYALGLRGKGEPVRFLNERFALASISMRSLVIG
jgi:4,5-DOPA dioxygenase extradiol